MQRARGAYLSAECRIECTEVVSLNAEGERIARTAQSAFELGTVTRQLQHDVTVPDAHGRQAQFAMRRKRLLAEMTVGDGKIQLRLGIFSQMPGSGERGIDRAVADSLQNRPD